MAVCEKIYLEENCCTIIFYIREGRPTSEFFADIQKFPTVQMVKIHVVNLNGYG